MSIPVEQQKEKIKKYFNLLVEEFIKDSRHKKDIKIVFQASFANKLKQGEAAQNTTIKGGGSETTWLEQNGKKVPGSEKTTHFPLKYEYAYTITFLNNYKNENDLRGTVVHEFAHVYLYATVGNHNHDDRFYSTMEWLEDWLNKNQGLSPRVDKSHDRDQYVGDNSDTKTNVKKNTCSECFQPNPYHSVQCSHNQDKSNQETDITTNPQKVAEFDLLKFLLENSCDLTALEKNYQQTVKTSFLYSDEFSSQNKENKNDSNKKSLDNLYQKRKQLLQTKSQAGRNAHLDNKQSLSTNPTNKSGRGVESILLFMLVAVGIILGVVIGYLLVSSGKETNLNRTGKKKR